MTRESFFNPIKKRATEIYPEILRDNIVKINEN